MSLGPLATGTQPGTFGREIVTEKTIKQRSAPRKRKLTGQARRDKIRVDAQVREAPAVLDDADVGDEAWGPDLVRKGAKNPLWHNKPPSLRPSKIVESPEVLWEKVQEYFQWVEANPLWEARVVSTRNGVQRVPVPKMRPMTIEGLCTFLGISRDTWNKWGRLATTMTDVVKHTDQLIREQKFSGAASGLLNPLIVARDLGLVDKSSVEGPDGGPVEVSARVLIQDRLKRLRRGSTGASEENEE